MCDEHILLFDEHKFNLMKIYLNDEFCYQKPIIKLRVNGFKSQSNSKF